MNVILQMPDGTTRAVPAGAEFRLQPGEKVVGATPNKKQNAEVAEVIKQTGLPLGDMIARATKAFGIQPCASCEKRRQIFNRISEIGVAETVRQLKETF